MQFAGLYRLPERVRQQIHLRRDFRYRNPLIQQPLYFRQHCRGQHRRAPSPWLLKKTGHPLFPVKLDAPLHADRAHPECPVDLGLRGAAVDIKLTGHHPERALVVDIVAENRQVSVNVGDRIPLPNKTEVGIDQGYSFREKRQLELGHSEVSGSDIAFGPIWQNFRKTK